MLSYFIPAPSTVWYASYMHSNLYRACDTVQSMLSHALFVSILQGSYLITRNYVMSVRSMSSQSTVFSKSPRTSVSSVNSVRLYRNSSPDSESVPNYTYTSYSEYTASLRRKRGMTDTVRQSNKAAILAVGEELRVLLHEEDPPMIKDRRFHLRTYSKCFIGSEMVDWLLKKGEVESRNEAVQMMQKLVDYGVLHHGNGRLC